MAKMHDEGVREYHEAELTVAAWRMFPESFGLGDFWNEYPDHKRVCNAYQTSKDSRTGPIGRGLHDTHPAKSLPYHKSVFGSGNGRTGTNWP